MDFGGRLTMVRAYVSIGSNIEPRRHVRQGLDALRAHFGELTISPVYRSRAVGFEGGDFLNLVVGFDTDAELDQLSAQLRAIEEACGRQRNARKFSSRNLDLDLLLYGDTVRRDGELEIPRSEITRYAFVLRPLADIAAELQHPVEACSVGELWQAMAARAQPMERLDEDPERWPAT